MNGKIALKKLICQQKACAKYFEIAVICARDRPDMVNEVWQHV